MKHPLSPITLSEQLMYGTFRLEVTKKNGDISYGTAFRYSCEIEGLTYNLIVTAKHNLEESVAIVVYFRR
ncbi:MAG: hypothetical protein C0508_30485, partial [Cyanobacteria bacterium PR.023]|nr:hypothetical protein [Cyanobacteria bacterium PR.023]